MMLLNVTHCRKQSPSLSLNPLRHDNTKLTKKCDVSDVTFLTERLPFLVEQIPAEPAASSVA